MIAIVKRGNTYYGCEVDLEDTEMIESIAYANNHALIVESVLEAVEFGINPKEVIIVNKL